MIERLQKLACWEPHSVAISIRNYHLFFKQNPADVAELRVVI